MTLNCLLCSHAGGTARLRSLALILALGAGGRAMLAQNPADSLARGLDSSTVTVRHDAVARLSTLPVASLPAAVRSRLVSLLEAEGVAIAAGTPLPSVADSTEKGEEYPGYIAELVSLVAALRDTRALRGLCLAGLGVSRDVQLFVAANAAASFPYLEETWANPARRRGLLETWGRILGTQSASLSSSQAATIRQHVMQAATTDQLGFVWAASLGRLADLASMVASIAASATDDVIANRAAEVGATLAPLKQALSSAALLAGTQGWLDAFCQGASGSRQGACQSLDNHFDNAIKQLGGNVNAARNVLDALINRAQTARDHGDLTASEAALVIENATLVRSRL